MTVNYVPKEGSNQLRMSFLGAGTWEDLQANNLTDELIAAGLPSVAIAKDAANCVSSDEAAAFRLRESLERNDAERVHARYFPTQYIAVAVRAGDAVDIVSLAIPEAAAQGGGGGRGKGKGKQ